MTNYTDHRQGGILVFSLKGPEWKRFGYSSIVVIKVYTSSVFLFSKWL